jgi:integrase
MLNKDVLSVWGHYKVQDIQRKMVIGLLDGIAERGAPIVANRTLAVMRRMFNFAMERDLIAHNPCYLVKPPGKESQRDRLLSMDEIRRFWQCLPLTPMREITRLALKLQLATAQRSGEVVNARWDEMDLHTQWWTISASQAKTAHTHRVFLSPCAMSLIEQIQALSHHSPCLFPSPRGVEHPMHPGALTHAMADSQGCFEGVEHFTPHDLRRTAASHMTRIGISRLVVSKILNHREHSVTAVYDRHSYDHEKQAALTQWGETLASIISEESDE